MEELSNFSLNLDVSLLSSRSRNEPWKREREKNVINENASSFVQNQRFEGTKLYYYFVRGNETKGKEWKGNGWNKNTEV